MPRPCFLEVAVTDDRTPGENAGMRTSIDVNIPRGPQSVPNNPGDDFEPTGGDRIDLSGWQPSIPLLLLPIRLETKFVMGDDGKELRIRILPDRVSVQGAAPASAGEVEEARSFWTSYHAAEQPAATCSDVAAVRQTARLDPRRVRRPTHTTDGRGQRTADVPDDRSGDVPTSARHDAARPLDGHRLGRRHRGVPAVQ